MTTVRFEPGTFTLKDDNSTNCTTWLATPNDVHIQYLNIYDQKHRNVNLNYHPHCTPSHIATDHVRIEYDVM